MADQKLKWYYRVDANGVPIEGALFARQSKPKNGHWRRLFLPTCCITFAQAVEGEDTSDLSPFGNPLSQTQMKNLISVLLSQLDGY